MFPVVIWFVGWWGNVSSSNTVWWTMIEFFHVECVFVNNYRMCPGVIWGNVFSWTMTDGVWEEYGLIVIVCVQEEYRVMDYDKMCPGRILCDGLWQNVPRSHMVRWMMITSLRNMVWSNSPGSAWCRMILWKSAEPLARSWMSLSKIK